MPRHNFSAAQSQVVALCDKHGVEYQLIPIWTAFADIIRSLKQSGQVWLEARQSVANSLNLTEHSCTFSNQRYMHKYNDCLTMVLKVLWN